MSLIVGGVVATTTTTTCVVLARRSFKFILLLHYFAQLVHPVVHLKSYMHCARVIVEEWQTLKGNHFNHSPLIRIILLSLRSRSYLRSCYLFFLFVLRTLTKRHRTVTQTFRAHKYNCNAGN